MRIRHSTAVKLAAVILMMMGSNLFGQGALTNISVSLTNNQAGEAAIYTFTFTTAAGGGGIPNNGKIEFIFPPGFNISEVDVAQSKNSNMTGGFSGISLMNKNTADEDTIRLTRDWTGNNVPGATEVSVAVGMIINHTVKASNYEVNINTRYNSNTIIDSGTTPDFSILFNSLHHFQVVSSGNAIAGQNFAITITAQDAYNNTVTTFAGQATLTDKSGAMTPLITGAFSNGLRSENLIFTRQYQNNQVTVTYDNKSGNSALFNVLSGPLHHFSFEPAIASPQTAGIAFSISIQARDQFDNLDSTFTDKVALTDYSGSLNINSNNFVNGILNQNVTITKSQIDNFIMVNHSGIPNPNSSNKFNVVAGNLAKFAIDPIASPQAAGAWFAMKVTAQDQYNNTVTSFNGTVNISDLTGSINPTVSGTFSNGQWSGQAKISSPYTNDKITVTRSGGSETGSSNFFNVTVGSLDHFTISNLATQTAGVPFTITITAKDIEGNTVTSFVGPVTIGDVSGSISPQTSGVFSNGVRNETVTVTVSSQSNQIVVTGNGKSGVSNFFTVNPNGLDHFAFGTITSPCVAGQSFLLSLEARDQYENKVTSFNGAVNLTDKTGTLSPSSSGNFSAGSKTVNVTITQKYVDDQITATDPSSGKKGTSNNFTILPNSVHHIIVRDNPGGMGNAVGDLSLNLYEKAIFCAAGYDQYNNYVRDVIANWGRTGSIDMPVPSSGTTTTFTAMTPQSSGQIYADTSGMQDYTGTIRVGNIHHILIRDAADGNGSVVGEKTITADDSLVLYAAAYDQTNHYLGPALVNWSSSGNLQPMINQSNTSMIIFSPTKAPASGKIIADHVTAVDDTTGLITITPGAPVGTIVLHPSPRLISAHPDSFAIVTSDVIRDRDGNAIAEGELFTATTSLGRISSPADQAAHIDGHQVKSNWSSQISFQINADSVGGTAFIRVHSVGKGSAAGDTVLDITSLKIVSITSDWQRVSQGQTAIPVRMTVQNRGAEQAKIGIGGANLRFLDMNKINRSGDYLVARTDTFTVIPGFGAQRLLTFSVGVSPSATTGMMTIDGNVAAVIKGRAVSDSSADRVGNWLVQTPPALRIERIQAANDTVVQGKNATVTVKYRNDGDAPIVVDSDSLTFWAIGQAKDVTAEYGQQAFPTNPDTISGHSARDFSYSVQVGASATLDTVQINAKVRGHDVNTGLSYSDNQADFLAGWRVKLASDLSVLQLAPSQMTVTSGQDRDWYVNMVVRNSGDAKFRLDSARVRFTIGGFNITNQFNIAYPTTFLGTKTDTLAAGATDTLRFIIDKTGTTLGTITIEATAHFNDLISGQIMKTSNAGILVQSPAQLKIEELRTSQAEVTIGQRSPWKLILILSNTGGSDVMIDTTQIKSAITFVGDSNFVVTPAAAFFGAGNFRLNAGAIDSLFFTIDTTGNLPGNRQINAKIYGIELNSRRSIMVQKNASIKVEQPANIRIAKTVAIAPNAPYVDSNQQFQIGVILQNIGEDAARNISVSVVNDSLSNVLNPTKTMAFVPGGKSDTLKFDVQALDGWCMSEVFTAAIDTGFAENTPEPGKIIFSPAIDYRDTITVQRPAKLKIQAVIASQPVVRALSYEEWQIRIAVQDSGAGFIKFDPPSLNDISILMNGEVQQDYTILPPSGLLHHPDLLLSWWAEDTLIYRVTRTGIMPGSGRIKLRLRGKYLNTNSTFEVSDSTGIYVQPSADVFIDITEPICPNINQYGIGQVNTNQAFTVRSKIRNTGAARVDNIKVNLTAPGYSIASSTIPFIPQSGFAWVNFNIVAQSTPAEAVNFIAKIESAVSHEGGLPATIGPASDSVATVRVHKPALLKMSIHRADSIFTVGQRANFQVVVQNLGTASVDSSGELSIAMPKGYFVVVNQQLKSSDTTRFKIDEPIVWQVQPPAQQSFRDTIIVAVSKPPWDLNTRQFAAIYNTDPFDTLVVKTISAMLSIKSFKVVSPNGAVDRTVSTNQDFRVQVEASASENMTNLWAQVIRPSGYGLGVGVDSVKTLINRRADWLLKAPKDPHASPKWIKVKVTGTTGTVTQSIWDSIAVVTVREAILSFGRVEISWPKTDSTLSVGQEFDLSATVINYGEANLHGQGFLKIGFGATGVLAPQEDTIKAFVPNVPCTWRLRAPNVPTAKAPIIVTIHTVPNDENTNEPATVPNRYAYFYVRTQDSGSAAIDSVWISSPSGAMDAILSTSQAFTVEAQVRWYNCAGRPSVRLILPGGFTTAESNPKTPAGTNQQGRVTWTIQAPEDARINQPLWLELTAQDSNSYRQFSITSDTLKLQVVDRALVQLNAKIESPASAWDHVVSTGQRFVVAAFLTNLGQASLKGTYAAMLQLPDGQGYTLLSAQTQTAAHDDTIRWTIEAPIYETQISDIYIQLINNPRDENTSVAVVPGAVVQGGFALLRIQTEEKTVTVANFVPRNKHTIARGDTSVAMLGLELICSGNANSNNVLLSGVKLKLKSRDGNLIIDPSRVIDRIVAAKYQDAATIYGEVNTIPTTNPIELVFSRIDTLKPEIVNKIEFRVDVLSNTSVTDFQLTIDSTDALYLVDEGSGLVPKLKNKSGEKLEILNIQSNPAVIIESNFDQAFRNYPNPFGTMQRPQTQFIYYLDQDTDVSINIYTLVGELVWSRSYAATEPQGKRGPHEGDIIWDGKNDQGYRVLNGVYIARLSTGNGKTALTKIAVIK